MVGSILILIGLCLLGFSLYKKSFLYQEFPPGNPDLWQNEVKTSVNNKKQTEVKKDNQYNEKNDGEETKKIRENLKIDKQEIESISRRLDQIINHLAEKDNKSIINETGNEEKKDSFVSESKEGFHQLFKEQVNQVTDSEENQGDTSISPDTSEPEIPAKYEQVINLVKEGKTGPEIAEELELGIRETEMILKLYQRKADQYAKKS